MSPRLLTIGHSNHSIDRFSELLRLFGIEVVADVRSRPYSRYSTQFNEPELRFVLNDLGVKYVPMGRQLGGRPDDASFYDADGHVLYGPLSRSEPFLAGLERLSEGLNKYVVAVMCSEEDPLNCHRRLLIARVLLGRGVNVEHARGHGEVETEEQVSAREAIVHPERRQLGMFGTAEDTWRSTRSVLGGTPRSSSSES